MNWLLLVGATAILNASTIFTDNYISDVYFKGREAAAQKTFHAFFQTILSVILIIIFGVNFGSVPLNTFILLFISGLLSSISGIFYYKALEIDDSTNLGIFIQLSPVLYLIFGWCFLGETISTLQLLAFFIILAAPFLIILTTRKRSRKIRLRAVIHSFLCVAIAVAGNIIFVQQNTAELSFGTELAFIFLGKGLGNFIIILARRKWFHRFNNILKSSHGKLLLPMLASGTLESVKKFCYYGALTLAPSIAIASATSDSIAPIIIFFMGIVLTIIKPSVGREKLNKKSVTVHLIATILVVIGIILIQK